MPADFAISSYGRLSLAPGSSNPDALHTLMGDNAPASLREDMSPDKHITARTPPFFLFSTNADQTVSSLNSALFYAELKRKGVDAELHIFEQGPHGVALGEKYQELAGWPMLLANWMRLHNWIPAPNQTQNPSSK